MPDGMIRADLGVKLSSHFLHADISSMSPGKLAKRFQFLSDAGDRDGEAAANEACFRAYDAVRQHPIGTIEDAMAVLIIAANDLYEPVTDRRIREDAAPAWALLGRVVLFLAAKEGVDPVDYGAGIIHSSIRGLPEGLRAGVWISRALRAGVRLLVGGQGEISLALPARTLENTQHLIEIEAEYFRLNQDLLRRELMSDIDETVNQPYQCHAPEVKGRAWLVSKPQDGFSALHAVEIPNGAVA